MVAYERRDFAGAAAETTLNGSITDSSTSITISSGTGWPTGSQGKFFAVIDPGLSTEEKVLCTARSGTSLTTVSRGQDGTTAQAHSSGATIRHCVSKTDFDEANYWVAELTGAATAAGDLVVADAANSLTKIAKGSASTVLQVSSGGTLQYGTVTSAMIADGTIVNADVSASAGIALSKLESISTGYVLGNNSGSSAAPSTVAISSLGDGFTTVTKVSDESVSSSTSVQNDDELLFTAASGTPYTVTFAVVYASPVGTTTPDIKIDLGEDSTLRGVFQIAYVTSTDSAARTQLESNQTATLAAGTAATKRVIYGWGWHVGAGGTFRVRWAQNTSNSNATTVYAGSILRYKAAT